MGVNLKFSCPQGCLVFAYTWKCGQRSRCTHTMRARTFVSVAVCVSRKLRPCPSYSGRRDRNNSVHWRSLYKGRGGTSCIQGTVLDPVSCRPLSFSQFQPWMLSILTRTHLVWLSISSVPKALLCLQRFWALQSVVLSIGPPPPLV